MGESQKRQGELTDSSADPAKRRERRTVWVKVSYTAV